ncbi:MAG: two-component system, OmpR family, sensor kinase [Actinomycetota bacterium]|nr:two-component system, OmpR family, sensor kinase [Actinomycetota bacterium]
MLRTRLLLILSGLVLAGLVALGAATYEALHGFLFNRVDRQLRASEEPMLHILLEHLQYPTAQGSGDDLPPATFGEIRSSAGTVIARMELGFTGSTSYRPQLPAGAAKTEDDLIFTTGAETDRSYHFRVLAAPLSSGQTLLVAVPLREVEQTLHHLLLIEGIVAALVIAMLAGAAWVIIRRSLRPLDSMGETAEAIAGGDLARRVEPADSRTEVGRLGIALNAMLARIEQSMDARTRSEERLRRFLADASHELRTPLTSIRGYAELFRRGAGARPQDLSVSMRRIEEEAARMGVLVEDLLVLAHLDELRESSMAMVDLKALLADSCSDARAIAPERRIDLEATQDVSVMADESRLRQAFANLLNNAIVHTPTSSPIEVSLDVRGRWAEASVRDHGPGLTADALEHVFDRFWRDPTKRESGPNGAGLGLSIVAGIVERHHGDVSASNAPDGGAVFTLRLPVIDLPSDTARFSETESALPT